MNEKNIQTVSTPLSPSLDPPPYESVTTFSTPLHQQLQGKRIILASTSLRRQQLMKQMGFYSYNRSIQRLITFDKIKPSRFFITIHYRESHSYVHDIIQNRCNYHPFPICPSFFL
ncbi:hypothetical protein PCK1_002404, partial [Pneumocystis canis]